MAILEDVTVGASVSGIAGNSSAVQIVAVKWHGSNALTVTYRTTDGNVSEQVLFREDEVRCGCRFDASGLRSLSN